MQIIHWTNARRHSHLTVFLILLSLASLKYHAKAFSIGSSVYDTVSSLPEAIKYPAAFAASFRTGAAISVINQPRLPSVDVPVGSMVLRLSSGQARLKLFYPAKPTTIDDTNMAPYCTNGRQTSNSMAGLVGFEQLGLSFLLSHLADANSGCIQNAAIKSFDYFRENEESDNTLPLLIYSHGYGGNMDMSTYFFRTMAAKGMIIAAIEHTDGTASSTILEDGSERRFNEYLMTGTQQLTRRASELLEAVEFLPKELQSKYNTTVGTIMLGGHSYGCPSAIMAANGASEDTNIDGLILHDPALGMGYGMLPPNGANSRIPTISYVSDEYNRGKVRYGDLTIHLNGCYHGNFVDAPLWAPSIIMRTLSAVIPAAGPADPMVIHQQLADSAMAFMQCKDPMSEDVMKGDLFERVQY